MRFTGVLAGSCLAPAAQDRALVRRLSPPTARAPGGRLCSTPRRCRTIPTMATRSVPVIDATEVLTGCVIERAYVDNGYRGYDAQIPRHRLHLRPEARGIRRPSSASLNAARPSSPELAIISAGKADCQRTTPYGGSVHIAALTT